jgi:general secretion pathway protein D
VRTKVKAANLARVMRAAGARAGLAREAWFGRLLRTAPALTIVLSACAPTHQALIPPPLSLPSTAGKSAASTAAVPSSETRFSELPVAPANPPSARTAKNRAADALAAPAPGGDEQARVNLEQVTIGVFAQLVFADILKKNVNIDPQVLARKDLVTFRSGSAQTAAQLENAAKLLLKSYGVVALDLGGLVRVVPDNANVGSLPEIRRGQAMPDTPLPLRPIFHLVDLRSVRNTEVASWLKTMFGDRIKAQEDTARNAMLLSGTPDVMEAALEAIRVLDQPALAGVNSTAITPAFWSADELARRLSEVLNAEGYAVQPLNQAPGGARYPIILLPISGLNSVYVFARGADLLKHVSDWARTLDRPNERGIGKNFFTYAVQHKDATALAQTLEQLLTGRTAPTAATGGAAAAAAAPRGAVVVDKATNMLIFQSSPDEFSQITALLRTLDRPTKTALIEVTVAELKLDDANQLGVEWFANHAMSNGAQVIGGTLGGLSVGSAGVTFKLIDNGSNVRAVLNALASNNKATVLSSPRLVARNGETATIQVGDEVPIITSQLNTGTTQSTSATQNQVLQTIQYRTTGVLLKIKPVIHAGDQIDLDVTQEVSSARSTNTGVNNSPTFGTRKVDTKLNLRNGATVLLGGLISEESSSGNAGVPLLKDIPLVGSLFNNKTGKGARTELIVLITPYVISNDEDATAVTQAFRKILGPWATTVAPGLPRGEAGTPVQPAPAPPAAAASAAPAN